MSSSRVVGSGWHDIYLRWDISTPEAVVGRLQGLPAQGPALSVAGRRLYAERDRFGRWSHLLGSRHVLLSWTVETATHGLIRRLELQAHLGDEGEDDLCPPSEFDARWLGLQRRMAVVGVLPVTDPRYVRVDPAVDVVFDDPSDGWKVLEVLRHARWPRGWYATFEGPPPYTTVAIKARSKIVGRAYCRNSKLRNGRPRWGKLRFEAEQRFQWASARGVEELANPVAAGMFWSSVFGAGKASGRVTRFAKEVEAMKLIERVQLGEISFSQYERMTAFLEAERLGQADRVYPASTRRSRQREARELGLAPADADVVELDESLDELLAVPRATWAA